MGDVQNAEMQFFWWSHISVSFITVKCAIHLFSLLFCCCCCRHFNGSCIVECYCFDKT